MMFRFLKNRFAFKMTKHFGNYGFSLLFLFAFIQRLHGITSLLPNGLHFILADVENCSFEQVVEEARFVQQKYGLSNMYIYSDAERSFRLFCYSIVDFKTLLNILLDFKHLDMIFFSYTARRKKATFRISKKKGRPSPKLVNVLESYPLPFPQQVQEVFYDTGVVKKGIAFSLGDED